MHTFLSKSIAILLGVVFFAGITSTAAAQTAQGQYIAKTQYQPLIGSNDPIIELRNPTLEGCKNDLTNQQAFTNTLGTVVIIQQCTFVAGASGPTTATNLSVAGQVVAAQAAYDTAVAALASGTGTQAQVNTAAANLQAAQQAAQVSSSSTVTDPNLEGINCGIKLFPGDSDNLADCIPVVVYYLIYKPTFYLLMGAGYIFDKTLIMSISKDFVDQPFVADSWKIIRDFSNMAFIFVLLYAGISTMLGMGNWRKTVIQVVVIALLINFSLLFTKVIIDAGNILATGIYSSIDTGNSFSASLASKFEPQIFLGTLSKVGSMDATIVFVIASIVSIFAAWVFFKAALLFIGRLLAFWFLMIVSPFAFISTTFPSGKGNKFNAWFGQLTGQAFVAPVFLFLLYIIMQVLSAGGGILSKFAAAGAINTSNPSWFDSLIAPILVAILVILALKESLKFAEGMAGEFGQLGAKIGGAVMGVAGGVALGGTALVGRKVIGGAAQRIADKGTFQRMATSDSKIGKFVGRMGVVGTEKARTGTFDARGVGLVQKGIKQTGVNMGAVGAGAAGGYAGMAKRQDEKDTKFAKLFNVSEAEKAMMTKEAEAKAKAAEEKVAKAKAIADSSVTGSQVKVAEEAVKSTQEVAEAALKKLDEAQKAYDTGYTDSGSPQDQALLKELRDAKDASTTSAAALTTKQTELTAATEKHAASQEAVDLNLAIKASKKAIDAGTKESTAKAIKELEEKRTKEQADRIGRGEGKLLSHAGGFGLGLTYSHSQAQKTAAKIRKGKTKEEKEQEDLIKNMIKAMKKEGENEGKPAETAPEASH